MAVIADSNGGGTLNTSGGWVAPWNFRVSPPSPPLVVTPSPAPSNLRQSPRPSPPASSWQPTRRSTPAQQGIAWARSVANLIGPPLTRAAVNAGIDIAASLLGASGESSTPVVTTPELPSPQPANLIGQTAEAIRDAVARAGMGTSVGLLASALAASGRLPNPSTLTPGLPAREPAGAWSEVPLSIPSVAKPSPSLPQAPVASRNPNLIGPAAPPGFATTTPKPTLGFSGGTVTAPEQVKAIMPPETPVTAPVSRSSSRSYTTRRSSAGGYTRSYVPRTYSYSSGYTGSATGAATGNFSALPPAYVAAFQSAFNTPIESYYTAERGGAAQALRDYQNVMNLWQARTGKPMTPEELIRLLMSFDAYTVSLGRNPSWEDFINFVTMNSERQYEPPAVPNISYIGMGNI